MNKQRALSPGSEDRLGMGLQASMVLVCARDCVSATPCSVVAQSLASTRAAEKNGGLPFTDHLML